MDKFKQGNFEIYIQHKGMKTVKGYKNEFFGIDKRGNKYIATHLASGLRLPFSTKRLKDAQSRIYRAFRVSKEINWGLEDISKCPVFEACKHSLRLFFEYGLDRDLEAIERILSGKTTQKQEIYKIYKSKKVNT